MPKSKKKYVILSQYRDSFAIVWNETDNKIEAEKIFSDQRKEDEIAVLIDTNSNKIIHEHGNISGIKIALDKNFNDWHR